MIYRFLFVFTMNRACFFKSDGIKFVDSVVKRKSKVVCAVWWIYFKNLTSFVINFIISPKNDVLLIYLITINNDLFGSIINLIIFKLSSFISSILHYQLYFTFDQHFFPRLSSFIRCTL